MYLLASADLAENGWVATRKRRAVSIPSRRRRCSSRNYKKEPCLLWLKYTTNKMLYGKYAAKIINCNMVQIQPRSDRGHFLPSKIPFIVLVAICAPLGLDTDGLNFIFDRDCTKRIIRHVHSHYLLPGDYNKRDPERESWPCRVMLPILPIQSISGSRLL